MKSILKFSALALLASALMASCAKEEDLQVESLIPQGPRTFTLTFAKPDTKVSIGEGAQLGKTKWEEGDEIFIHTGHIRDGEYATVILKAEDISADGKKATIIVPELKVYDWVANGWTENAADYSSYYASYPASAQANPTSPTVYSRSYFKNTNQPLMAGYSVGDEMVFYNLSGIITFKVTGEFDSYSFYGNGGETVGYETYAVELLPKGQDFKYKTTAGDLTTISGTLKEGTNYICLPNGADFTTGFTIVFKKGGESLKMVKTDKPVNVVRNGILELGDVTAKLEAYVAPEHHNSITDAKDLSSQQANCFVIAEAGAYKFPAVKGNSEESAGEVKGVEILWETYNTKASVEKNSVIAKVDYEDNWVYFQTPETLKPGNALIAAKNGNDEIIWSWHIWIPETPFTADGFGISSKPIMSRNLGALVDAEVPAEGTVDIRSTGLYYQWGRKDPFVGYKWGNPSVDVGVSGKSGRAMGKASEQITLAASIADPTTFVAYKGDWLNERMNDLWGKDADKTIYDPCPAGYRVPDYNTADAMWQKVVDLEGFVANGDAHYWKLGTAVFNMAGFYDYDGGMSHPYDRCFYWSNKNNSSEEYGECQYVYFESDVWKSEPAWGKRKACALPIRCVKMDGSVTPDPEEPGPVEITIDGNMADWTSVKGATEGNHTLKVAADKDYLYVYSFRANTGRYSQIWGGEGYIYLAFELDGNPDNGETLNSNGPFDFIGFIFPYGGTADAPAITEAAGQGGESLPAPYTLANVVCKGYADATGAYVEYKVPRADLPAFPATPVTITSWGNKDMGKAVLTTTIEAGTEPEHDPMKAEWLFTADACQVEGSYGYTFSSGTKMFKDDNTFNGFEAVASKEAGDGGLYVLSNVTEGGKLTFVQVDKTELDKEDKAARTVGSTGHPFVTGVWQGDYWLFEASDGYTYKAGTKVHIKFVTRVSGTGMKYWMLEYWDGLAWQPAYEPKSVTSGDETIQYNFTPTSETSNSTVSVTWTLAADCAKQMFRYVCAGKEGLDGALPEAPWGGTCRIAGAANTSPVFEVLDEKGPEALEDGSTRVTIDLLAYAAEQRWQNGNSYPTVVKDGITLTASWVGDNANGYYYDTDWRFYQARKGGLTIAAPEGHELVKATFTYSVSKTGVLLDPAGNQVPSGTECALSGQSALFTVGNTGTATNGQARISKIVVDYK